MSFSLFSIVAFATVSSPESFKYHLIIEPHSFNPGELRGLSSRYLFFNVYRNLYRYNKSNDLVPELAEKCIWSSKTRLLCYIKANLKWSDGSPLTSEHFIKSYKQAFDPKVKSTASQFLLDLKNAKAILANTKPLSSLGVKALNKHTLEFSLEQPNQEFLHNLALLQTSPIPSHPINKFPKIKGLVTSGPFVIQEWVPGKRVHLTANPHYHNKKDFTPNVEVLFVEHDQTALDLYLKGKLNLLRRVPAHLSKSYKKLAGYSETDLYRFDYLGFHSGSISKNKRKALIESLRYEELQKIYEAKTPPGCPSLPRIHYEKYPCYSFKKSQPFPQTFKSRLGYSAIGGEGIRVGMEWVQFQWKKHLGVKLELSPFELGTLTPALKSRSLPIFRKSVHIDRPTCLAALELFHSKSRDNYIDYKSQRFDQLLLKLRSTKNLTEKKKICSQATRLLMESYLMIPLGQIHTIMVHDMKFKGFFLNGLDVLDLTQLAPTPPL